MYASLTLFGSFLGNLNFRWKTWASMTTIRSPEGTEMTDESIRLSSTPVPVAFRSPPSLACRCASQEVTSYLNISNVELWFQGEAFERFEEYRDEGARVRPKSLCWLPTGDLIVGCSGGQLLKVRQPRFPLSKTACYPTSRRMYRTFVVLRFCAMIGL